MAVDRAQRLLPVIHAMSPVSTAQGNLGFDTFFENDINDFRSHKYNKALQSEQRRARWDLYAQLTNAKERLETSIPELKHSLVKLKNLRVIL